MNIQTPLFSYYRKTAAELGELSEDAKSKLAKLGYPVTRSRRHQEDSEEEESDDDRRRRKSRRN